MLSWVAACESNLEKLCKKRLIICREIHPKPASLSKKNFCDAKTYYRGIFAGVLLVKMSAPRISWFPGHMASAIKQIEQRIKVVDLVFHSGFVFLLFWIAVPKIWKASFQIFLIPTPSHSGHRSARRSRPSQLRLHLPRAHATQPTPPYCPQQARASPAPKANTSALL